MDVMDETIANNCIGIELSRSGDHRDANWYNITATSALIYGLLTVLVNVRVYVVIIKNRKKNEFSSSFYVAFIIATSVDICWWITNQLKDHVGLAPILHFMLSWIPQHGFIVTLWYFLLIYFMFADMLVTILVSLNRFTTIVFKNGDMYWKKVFPILLLIVFLVPIYFSYGVWFNLPFICSYNNYGNFYYYFNQFQDYNAGIQINVGEFFVAFCSAIINAIVNIITAISVILQRKKFSHNHGSNKLSNHVKGPEMKLLVISFIMFVNQCAYGSIHLQFTLVRFFGVTLYPISNARLFEVSRFVIDFMALSPCWILIIMSKHVRKRIIPVVVNVKIDSFKAITNTRAVLVKPNTNMMAQTS